MLPSPLQITGVEGSPYTRKLRALLRYRRIPFVFLHQGSPEAQSLPQPKLKLIPQLMLPNAAGVLEARVDTTPLIRLLEAEVDGRSVIPADPVVAFLDALLEDFADEWLTKAMFHYRWTYRADIDNAARLLPRWPRHDQPDDKADAMGKQFAARQIERLWVVGSNEKTAPVIEESYRRILRLLDARLTESRFVMGARPGAADFGFFGQLTQLVRVDPTPAAIAHELAIRVVAWVDKMEDQSGVEPTDDGFVSRDDLSDAFRALLAEVGRVYAPFLVANGAALAIGAGSVDCRIDGRDWTQKPFPYQGKCLQALRGGHAALGDADREFVDELLAGTGCEVLFA